MVSWKNISFSIDFCRGFIYLECILKAIHNKDYSVVKTFKAGLSGLVFFIDFFLFG